jgi:hypothetical protein
MADTLFGKLKSDASGAAYGRPDYDCIVAAADPVYFFSYAPTLIASAVVQGVPLHISLIIPPEGDDLLDSALARDIFKIVRRIEVLAGEGHKVTVNFDFMGAQGFDKHQRRVYFACSRPKTALWLTAFPASADHSYFLLDIDSIICKPFKFPETQLCFFRTDPVTSGARTHIEERGMHLLASCFVRRSAGGYLADVCEFMQREEYRYWFLDQVALHEVLAGFPALSISDMNDKGILDSEEFGEGAVWSGRGSRKFSHTKYMAEAAKYRDLFYERDKK